MRFTRKIILTLLIIVLCSALAFASDDSPSPEQAPLEVDWRSLDLQTSAGAVRAVTYTTTDIYNLLDSTLLGNSPFAGGILAQIADQMTYWVSGQQYTIADLQGMSWSLANSINNQLTSTNSILGNIYNNIGTTNAKLEYVFSAIEDTINIKWYSSGISWVGVSRNFDRNFLSSVTSGSNFKFVFNIPSSFNGSTPSLIRLFIPYYITVAEVDANSVFTLNSIQRYTSGFGPVNIPSDSFFEFTQNGVYLYLFSTGNFSTGDYYFEISSSNSSSGVIPSVGSNPVYIPFDTLDYQIIKTAFYQAKSSSSLDELKTISSTLSTLAFNVSSGSQAAEALADYFVSPQKQAAENASQQVINSTLNNFTGSGSGAAKSSDSNAMKDVSGSLQSGLNAGGSVSGATGVFNSSGDFWKWFSQENSNYINNPYPAPVVSPTRGVGDEIVDFLTPNSNELQDLLRQGGDQR